MSSATSPVKETLERYLVGRVKAEVVARVVLDAYYRHAEGPKGLRDGRRMREALRPVLDVVERAAPGVAEFAGRDEVPGFEVRLAERPFPVRYEAELKQAAERALAVLPPDDALAAGEGAGDGFLRRVLGTIERWIGLGRAGAK